MSWHQNWGFTVRKTAATSMAHTKQIKTANLRAHVGSVRTEIPPSQRLNRLTRLYDASKRRYRSREIA